MPMRHSPRFAIPLLALVFSLPAASPAHEHQHHAADAQDVTKSARSGAWSSPETWEGGKVPGAGARVWIQKGHEVLYDRHSDEVVRGIQISGTLTFATDRDTRLDVGLIRIEDHDEYTEEGFDCLHAPAAPPEAKGPGPIEHEPAPPTVRAALEIGRPDAPLSADHTALIRLHYIEGMNRETCPAIVCCGGRMDLHGAPLERTWVKLPFQSARVGEARVVMPADLPGWKVGDRIIISGTTRQQGYLGTRTGVSRNDGEKGENSVSRNPTTEERIITNMRPWRGLDSEYQIVSFDEPLEFEHYASGEHRAEVANLSRNVIVESADPEGVRGHTMYHADSAGSISYAEFRHLGKRDVLGKYPIHYHLVGNTMRGSSLIGVSVWDSHNRWITIHGTQYLVVRDCIGYKSVGHGYFLEDGTEVFNILDRNLAVQALGGKPLPEQVLPYDRNLGSGYWWANSLNTFTRNVAVECDEDGFRLETVETPEFDPVLPVLQSDGRVEKVDIRTLPFVRFDGNEAHCQRLFAINLGGFSQSKFGDEDSDVEGVGPDYQHPFVLRNTKIWNTHWAFHCGSPSVMIDGMQMHACFYGIWRCVMLRHEYRGLAISDVDTPVFFPRTSIEPEETDSGVRYSDLDPIDDLPPVTVITHVEPISTDTIRVRGVTSDNYDVKQVLVNDRPARATGPNFMEWEIDLPASSGGLRLTAHAEDAEGNVETMAHVRDYASASSAILPLAVGPGRRESSDQPDG
ncbi:MAG: G8 domain-containing protein [Planctomycetaceae bacterium]